MMPQPPVSSPSHGSPAARHQVPGRRSYSWPAGTFAAKLSRSCLSDLLKLSAPYRVPARTALIRQGEQSTSVFLLRSASYRTSACAKITALLANGHEGLLGIRVSGDLVGELGVVRATSRSATVTICAPALVHAIGQDAFLRFLSEHPDAWRAVSSAIADRLDWANQWRLEFAAHDVATRVARVLVLLAERHGHPTPEGRDLGVPISQEELGRLIGSHRDAVVKCVGILRNQNFIKTGYRRIILTNTDELRKTAQLT